MISQLLSKVIYLGLGKLYPAYASYKAVKTKNVKEYVKWMMYWIVFALFTSLGTFIDFFFSWFPFYYEIKILFLIWMLSPTTNGSSMLYRKFVHPALLCREKKIDDLITAAQTKSYDTAIELCRRGVKYLSGWVMEMAISAPGMMGRIINGFGQMREQPTQVVQPTYREDFIVQADNLRPGVADDEIDKHNITLSQEEMDQSKSDSDEDENTAREITKITRKWKTSNVCFSSDAESDNSDFQPAVEEI